MLTVALGINVSLAPPTHAPLEHSYVVLTRARGQVLLGDAIVWWRACVVWRHKLVYCLGAVLLSITVGASPSHAVSRAPTCMLSEVPPYSLWVARGVLHAALVEHERAVQAPGQ